MIMTTTAMMRKATLALSDNADEKRCYALIVKLLPKDFLSSMGTLMIRMTLTTIVPRSVLFGCHDNDDDDENSSDDTDEDDDDNDDGGGDVYK